MVNRWRNHKNENCLWKNIQNITKNEECHYKKSLGNNQKVIDKNEIMRYYIISFSKVYQKGFEIVNELKQKCELWRY